MKNKWLKSPILLFVVIIIVFFFKFFFMGQIPVPGDLLVSEFNPWKEYSYLGYVAGTYPSKLQYGDVIHQIYPWKTFVISALKNGQIPLWNPYNFSGHPFLADIQSAVFQPLNILYFIMSQANAWAISVIFQPLLTLIGTYLYVKKIGLGKKASVFSAISYGLCLFMSVFLEYNTIGHIMALLPFSLLAIELLIESASLLRIILFVASITLTVFAGHIQLAGFNIIFIFCYSLARIKNIKEKFKKTLLILMLFVISLSLSAIQLIPTIELFLLSARVSQNYQFLIEKLLIQPFQTILFFSPDFFGNPVTRSYHVLDSYPGNSLYIGLIPIIFALSAVFYFRKNWFISFFTSSSVILLLLFFRTPFSELFYKLHIPYFSTGSPTNAIYLLSFSLAVLAGFGIEYFEKQKKNKILLICTFIFIFILVNILLLKNIADIKNAALSLMLLGVFITIFVSEFILKIKRGMIINVIILITVIDLFLFFQKFNPFVPKETIFPKVPVFNFIKKEIGISRFWGYGPADIEPNFNTQYGISMPEGTDPLYPKSYGQLIQSSRNGEIVQKFSNQTRSDAIIVQESGDKFIKNPYRLKLLEMLGTSYILDKKNRGTSNVSFPVNQFTISYQDNIWRLFKDKSAANRAFLVTHVDFYNGAEEFEKKFFSDSFNLRTDILVENNAFSKNQLKDIGKPATLKLVNYSPNNVTFSTSSKTSQILFLSDTFYPGWKATIDGADTPIIKANYSFRAIAIPKGIHIIKFSYMPVSFLAGVLISLISLATLIFLCILNSRKKIF
jgi:uncharacterized membrane protein YfhO